MRCQFSLVGYMERPGLLVMNLDVVPRLGDTVEWPQLGEFVVRHIGWYLTHDDEGKLIDEPFVYIVVGPSRTFASTIASERIDFMRERADRDEEDSNQNRHPAPGVPFIQRQ